MRASALSRLRSAFLILGLLVCWSLSGQPCAADKPKVEKPPFQPHTELWDADFTIVSTVYDKANKKLTWVLEAKKDATLRSYKAELNDEDGVEISIIRVKLDQNPGKIKKGTQVQAVISLTDVPLSLVKILIIRERKPVGTDDDK